MIKPYSLAALFFLGACAHTDAVTFVTSTDLGIDGDLTTQNVTIGFSRTEGVAGPVYATGAVPPVFAKIESNSSLTNPKISQFYATGDAADIATQAADSSAEPKNAQLTGRRKAMFFGTTNGIGFKARFTGGTPTSLTLGLKRQEYSHIPILKNENDVDVYGSVLARIEVGTSTTDFKSAGFNVGQLFATGIAADQLAPQFRTAVTLEAETAANSVVSDKYLKDDAGDRLAASLNNDLNVDGTPNADNLRAWMASKGLPNGPGDLVVFIRGAGFEDLRAEAVSDLNL